MANTTYIIKKKKVNLLNPYKVIELIEKGKVSDIELIKKYNEIAREMNRYRFNDKKPEMYYEFLDAHSKFIDLMKIRGNEW